MTQQENALRENGGVKRESEGVKRENGGVKRGRPFANGNAGRPRGSKNRKTVFAQGLLAGEEIELVRKAIELAKAGNVQLLKFLPRSTFAQRPADQDRHPAAQFPG